MAINAHQLSWPQELLNAFGGKLVSVSERDYFQVRERCESLQLEEDVFRQLFDIYLQIAAWLNQAAGSDREPNIIGINGAQGSGKSTAAHILKCVLECCYGKRVCVISLDDLYLSKEQRAVLARDVHPLLVTRGVPGTHEIKLGIEILEQLQTADDNARTAIPSFDKAHDDRRRPEHWPVFTGKPDIIVIEGWCVSAIPQTDDDLLRPVNELERLKDHDGVWRRFVNEQLQRYQELFNRIDFLIMLKVPGFVQVQEWRMLQERKLWQDVEARNENPRALMDEEQIYWFIEHFERLTRWILNEMPSRADLVLDINEAHQIAGIVLKGG